MEKVKLGNSEIEFKPIVLGGNVFGWTVDEQQSFALLDVFVDMGFSFVDTSNNYSHWVQGHTGSESESIIGKWVKKRDNRDKIQIATKVGGRRLDNDKPNLKKEYIIRSLKRYKIHKKYLRSKSGQVKGLAVFGRCNLVVEKSSQEV